MLDNLLLKIKNRRLVMMVVPLVAGLVAGGALVVKPGLAKLATIKAELSSLTKKDEAYKYILGTEKKLEGYKNQLSKSADKTWLIEQLNAIADKTGLSVVSITPEEPSRLGDFLDKTSVRIESEGNYHQLGQFVSRVESLEHFTRIMTLEITAPTSESASVTGADSPATKRNVYKISMSVGLFSPVPGAF